MKRVSVEKTLVFGIEMLQGDDLLPHLFSSTKDIWVTWHCKDYVI